MLRKGGVVSAPPGHGARKSRFRRPQVLRNLTEEERAEERTSTWLELFFDLCFVVAVAALARGLHDDPTLGGTLRFIGLFVPIWWAWMTFTWYATAFDNDDVPYRVTLLAAMLFMLGISASVEGVGAQPGATVGFVVAYAALRLLLVWLFLRARSHTPSELRGFVAWYAAGNALGAVLWLASLLAPAPLLYVLWAVALSVELLAPILAVRTLDEPLVSFHPRHIAERYGLFTIIVLGESVLAVASGTAGTEWARAAVFTAALSFVVAACIWWIYFDYVEITGMELAPKPAFYWGYGHLAVYAAIAAFGVGAQLAIEGAAHVESAALAPAGGAGFGLAGQGILAGSVAVYLLAVSFVQYVNHHSLSERTALARLAVAAGLLILVILGGSLSPPVFAAAVALALAALTAFETVYAERFTQRSTENH